MKKMLQNSGKGTSYQKQKNPANQNFDIINKGLLITVSLIVGCIPNFVFAQCPVCTVAIGVGVGLCRYLGIDDLITGI